MAGPNRQRAEALLPVAIINKTMSQSIASSITVYGRETRLDSVYSVFPKMVMVERNRHRGLSLSDRSSRAVPPEKLFAEIRSGVGLAMPAKFKKRVKGMGGGEEFTGDELIAAQVDWIEDALNACDAAERAALRGEAKETVNRRLDPYIYAHTLQTATLNIWLNFLGLRLHEHADPTIQLLAQTIYHAMKGAEPKLLQYGHWHLPFVGEDDLDIVHLINTVGADGTPAPKELIDTAIKVSSARCAHLSFNDHETGKFMPVERLVQISDSLRDSSHPLHASPFEHQATPDRGTFVWTDRYGAVGGNERQVMNWVEPFIHGNLYGWKQYRKLIPGEAIASLPEGYSL